MKKCAAVVRVKSDAVDTWLNSGPIVHLVGAKISSISGRIALEIHEGGGIRVRWSNIELKNYNSKMSEKEKELLFVDMDGVLVDFYEGVKESYPDFDTYSPEHQRKITTELSAQSGFFTRLKPIAGAIDAFRQLAGAYDLYILSTPDWHGVNSWTEKRIWVEQYLGELAFKRLILTHNKGLFSGRALIDDRVRNGVDRFNGEHIHFGTPKFPDWQVVLAYLIPEGAAAQRFAPKQ